MLMIVTVHVLCELFKI